MAKHRADATRWIKSSYSGSNGGNCIEYAPATPGNAVPVRDSKRPHGPLLAVPRPAWTDFVGAVRRGELGG
ncbi:DUF397 domain-containing protein [Streptomyces sp. OF1]|uniref:DUF397 domain-containing protein n=1 Tax=Streptomyces alkaliterrae TaxID=2213162 RepID=A0A5P0YUR2_9ACTN|nr:DUF397 domain-containing protein [Streptomyces alkaliterrae]